MQFSTSTDRLRSGLEWVAQSLPNRSLNPILAAVTLELDPACEGVVTLRAYDYELATTVDIPVTSWSGKRLVAVSGRLLVEIAKALPPGEVHVATQGACLRLEAGAATFSLPLMPEEDYPTLPTPPAAAGTVDADVFTGAVRQVAWAASRDPAVPLLTTTQLSIDPREKVITLAATDRYRLAIKRIPYIPGAEGEPFSVYVPGGMLDKLARGLGRAESVTLAAQPGEPNIGFVGERRTATVTQMQKGQYPPVQTLIPTQFAGVATMPTAELLEVVRRVAVVSDTTGCRLMFDKGLVTVTSGGDNGEHASDQLAIDYEGQPLTVSFRHNYLLDVLTHIGAEKVTACLVDPIKPAKFCPAGDGGEDLVYVVMPLRAGS